MAGHIAGFVRREAMIQPGSGRTTVVPLDGEVARTLAGIFKALADPTRLRIITMLLQAEMCVNDLAAALELSQSVVSHQLSDMREMRLVRYRREGRRVYYALDDDHVRDLVQGARAHVEHV